MPDPKLIDYVKTSLAQGKSKENIYKELLEQNITVETIQENFTNLTTKKETEDTSKKTIQIIVVIGAVLIGAGIFSFIAANWQEMARPIKIAVILISMIASYSSGWYMKEKSKLFKTAEALILLGSIIYGAGVFLVAQMFNVRTSWPDGFILWMIGAIAMAFAVESYPLFYFSISLGIIALFGYPSDIFIALSHNSLLLTSSLLLLISTVITFTAGWIIRKRMPPELKEYY